MSSIARVGLFGRTDKRDYVSNLSLWHSCFLLRQLIPPQQIKHTETYLKKYSKNRQSSYSAKTGYVFHATGSSVEGLSLPWNLPPTVPLPSALPDASAGSIASSDTDMMIEYKPYVAGYSPETCNLLLRDKNTHPGYALLQKREAFLDNCPDSISEETYLSNSVLLAKTETFVQSLNIKDASVEQHGPAHTMYVTELNFSTQDDYLFVIPCSTWPHAASTWLNRPRISGWPTSQLSTEIAGMDCHLVPIPHKKSKYPKYELRISFSLAEEKLTNSLNIYQRLCYIQFKTLVKMNTIHVPTFSCKTILFWACEQIPQAWWQADTMLNGVTFLLDKLIHALVKHELPHYFIPDNNLIKTIPRQVLRDELKTLAKIRSAPLKYLYKFTWTSPNRPLASLIKLHELLEAFTVAHVTAKDFLTKWFNHMSFLNTFYYFSGPSSHTATEFFYVYTILERLKLIIRDGQDSGPIMPTARCDVIDAIMIKEAETFLKTEKTAATAIFMEMSRLKLAEIYHHYGQSFALKNNTGSSAHQTKVEVHQPSSQADFCFTKAEEYYNQVMKNFTQVQGAQRQDYNCILCKYANYLHQTDKDLWKVVSILQEVLASSENNGYIFFHKRQRLTTDSNIRLHLDDQPSLYIPITTKDFAYYLLGMTLIKLNSTDEAITVLARFEAHLKTTERDVFFYRMFSPYSLVGHILYALGDFARAKQAFVTANKSLTMQSRGNSALITICNFSIYTAKTTLYRFMSRKC